MKQIAIAGTIGKDAQTKQAGNGVVTSFSVAVSHFDGREKSTIWFDCSWWGVRGEKVSGYLTKGIKVSLTGDLSTREYDGKTYLKINVNDVTLQGGKPSNQSQQQSQQSSPADLDDEIPF